MRLQSIELKGFKSFRDKTKITFDNQITAIVGPNGSGKSNVSDAIRWVLGEQSAKSLRGSKMNEVIFQGAENKSPLNMAEVSLIFDNKDKSLDLEYDKVVISRRIYRDGENEYKINNKKVRLKDIKELFLDTGIGKEGYSLIGQGRIDEIISSSNLERRAIFEEASGIAKHKYRRDEANKRLTKVTEDLEIIEYEWEYKEKDLVKLKAEAENYKKWQELTENLNEKSYYYLKNKSKSLLEDRNTIENDIANNTKLIDDLSKSIAKIKEDLGPFNEIYEKLKADIAREERNLRALEKSIEDSKNKINLNTQKLSFSSKDLERIDANLSANESKHESLKERLTTEEKNLANKKSIIADISKNIEAITLELEDLVKTSEKSKDELATVEAHKNEIDKAIYDYEINKRSREIIDKKREEDLKINSEKLAAIEAEIEDINNKLKDLSKEKINLYNGSESISTDINANKESLDETDYKLRSINNDLNQISIDLKTQINEYKFNKNMLENNEGYFYSVSDFLNKTKAQGLDNLYIDTLANLISVKEGYEEIIDNLMGASLQNIVTRTKDESRDLIKFVNDNRMGRITFLPIDSVSGKRKDQPSHPEVIAMAYDLIGFDERLSGIIDHFLGSTVVVKDIDAATSLSKKIRGYRIISLNLDLISSWGSMASSAKNDKRSSTNLLNRKKKLKESAGKINQLKLDKEGLEEALEKLTNTKEKISGTLTELNQSFVKINEDIAKVNNEITGLDYRLETIHARKAELEASISTDLSDFDDIDIESLYKKRDKFSGLKADYEEKIQSANKRLDELEITKTKSQNELELNQRDINMINNSIGEISDQLNNLAYSLKLEGKLRTESTSTIESTKYENQKLEQIITDNTKKVEAIRENLLKLKDDLTIRENQNKNQLEDLKILEQKLNEAELSKVKFKYKYESITKDYDNLIDDIKPFISKDLKEIENLYKDKDLVKVNKSELISLQKSINNIGYFTSESLENYTKASEDFIFIDQQMSDLRASKANIEQMIDTLENEMKEEFKKNFELINEKFARIFQTLFMGGEARLKLDNDDELIAGVDIIARPPSKSLKSISLLSGGEKALTAVALLFAIFETNPAPFAILDEIDAALDETNIKRYIEYLKTLSENSQFIMITHRQTTMQLAEMIYGITIGDDGISKIYSIDFDNN